MLDNKGRKANRSISQKRRTGSAQSAPGHHIKTLSASVSRAPAPVTKTDCPALLTASDVEQSKQQYLAQWYHPLCGGRPYAYVRSSEVECDGCGYSVAAGAGEPLGRTLLGSEFKEKKGTKTFLS